MPLRKSIGRRRHALAALLRVPLVVEADRQDVGRHDRGQSLALLDDPVRDPEGAEQVPGDLARRAVRLQRGVGRAGGREVAQDLHGSGRSRSGLGKGLHADARADEVAVAEDIVDPATAGQNLRSRRPGRRKRGRLPANRA